MMGEKDIEPNEGFNAVLNSPLVFLEKYFQNLAKEQNLKTRGKNVQNTFTEDTSCKLATTLLIHSDTEVSNNTITNKFASCQTKADGNCFFHAVFGVKNINGQYETAFAKEMRQEWYNFLSQFNSLKDENMPDDLKHQLKKIFTIFLNDPSYLTGITDHITHLVNETNNKIKHSDTKIETLKNDIVQEFCKNKMFRTEIVDVIRSIDNTNTTEHELLNNQKMLKTRISACLEECALKLYPQLTKSQYQEMYDTQTIADIFLEDTKVYKNYVEAIRNQEYFILFEEIPILSSLTNVKITICRNNTINETVFEPNLGMLGNYKPSVGICSDEVTIFHAEMHFSRAEISCTESQQHAHIRNIDYQSDNKDSMSTNSTNMSSRIHNEQIINPASPNDLILESPLSTTLNIDTNLFLGRENYQQLLALKMKTKIKRRLQIDAFPNAYELAQLSLKVYTEKAKGESDDAYEEKLDLPKGWQLLTTATNPHLNNGYFGAAFVNPTKRHVVIAHRGTTPDNLGAWWTNVQSVVFENCSARMSSAATFADKVMAAMDALPAMALAFTGHSLGGWLAHITCFTAMYLRSHESHFAKNAPSQAVHSHTVAFDSPGCYSMLKKLQKDYDTTFLHTLDITNYLSAPNRVNTFKRHSGTLYRIFPDLSDMDIFDKHSPKYTPTTHNMDKIAGVFTKETGHVRKDTDGSLKINEVTDWPISGFLGRGEEYIRFFEWATHLNDYHPTESEMVSSESQTILRYRTKKFDATTCSLNVFASNELTFLEIWHAMKLTNMKLVKLEEFTTVHKLRNIKDLLPDFVIDKKTNTVKCKYLSVLINCTKNLFRWLSSSLTKAMKEQLTLLPSVAESIFISESKTFLNCMINCNVQFEDIGFHEFLKSNTQHVLSITTPDIEFELVRTYSVCSRIQNELHPDRVGQQDEEFVENCRTITLNWQQILNLKKFVNVSNILTSKPKTWNLAILTFTKESEISENDKVLLDSIFWVIRKAKRCKKIIFINSTRSSFNKYISLQSKMESFSQKDVGEITFSDLTQESQRVLLNKPVIILRGTQYSLGELFKTSDGSDSSNLIQQLNEATGGSLLKNIIDTNMEVVKIPNALMELVEVFYAKFYKNVSTKCSMYFILNIVNNIHCAINPLEFFVSGIPEAARKADAFLNSLKDSDKKIMSQIENAIGSRIFINKDEESKELKF